VTSPIKISQTNTTPEEDVETANNTPWTVVVWDDPINLMEYVTYVFKKIFGYDEFKANTLMLDVHQKGRARVFFGEKIESEKYVHKLHGFGLWATMEQNS